MKRMLRLPATALVCLTALAVTAAAHCQIPCGIYGDALRFKLMNEHIDTMEKSIKQIQELGKDGDKNYNQLVRWVVNKETHAEKLTEILNYYFSAQRIKPVAQGEEGYDKYLYHLSLLHKLVFNAMKVKQTTDLSYTETLRDTLYEFEASYMGKPASEAKADAMHDHDRDHDHH